MGVVSTLQAAVCVLDMSRMHCSAVAGEVDGIKRCPCRRVAHDHPVNREHPHTNTHALPSSALSPFRMLYSSRRFLIPLPRQSPTRLPPPPPPRPREARAARPTTSPTSPQARRIKISPERDVVSIVSHRHLPSTSGNLPADILRVADGRSDLCLTVMGGQTTGAPNVEM
jgi:hypothetical protein